MRVIDVRDFSIPSDENDYDELVAFADTMASIPQFDAVPITILNEIRAEIIDNAKRCMNDARASGLYMALSIIDKYKNGVNK